MATSIVSPPPAKWARVLSRGIPLEWDVDAGWPAIKGCPKKKPDGFDKRVWLQTRRIRSSRRANCKASAFILNVAKKYVKNELKTLASVQLDEGNQDSSFNGNSRAGNLPVPTIDR